MILDRSHTRWAVFSGVVLLVSAVWYGVYATREVGGPRGGTLEGLVFGFTGTAFILFAAFLGVRKRRPHYRIGRASWWLKGHLWLGGISFPIILFHAGFGFGGALTQVLMWLFIVVFATGVYGLFLQQFLPRLMTKNIPQETVYEQIEHVCRGLFEEAYEMAKGGGTRSGAVAKAKSGGAIQGRVVKSRAVVEADDDGPDRGPLVRFVQQYMGPYFEHRRARKSELHDARSRVALFDELRVQVDPSLHPVIDDFVALCEQREQLRAQRRMHHWMHAWLLLHVPLSWTMVALTIAHAVMALYY